LKFSSILFNIHGMYYNYIIHRFGADQMSRKPIGKERLRDVISYRLTDAQRAFLENISVQNRVGLAEAARSILDEAMTARGIEG